VVVVWLPGLALAQEMSAAELTALVRQLQRQVRENADQVAELRGLLEKKNQEITASQREIERLEADLDRTKTRVEQAPVFRAEAPKAEPGSQFGLLVGAAAGPYNQDWGYMVGGFYDFTLVPEDPFGNRLCGEIFAAFTRHDEEFNTVTSPLGIVQNDVNIQIETVTVALDLKYCIEQWDKITPYLVAGPAIYVMGHEPRNQFVAGIGPLPPELAQHDYPSGNADIEWGVNMGLGLDVELTELLHVGFDGRYNLVTDANNQFLTLGGYLSFAF
jgi:hypothetical protein